MMLFFKSNMIFRAFSLIVFFALVFGVEGQERANHAVITNPVSPPSVSSIPFIRSDSYIISVGDKLSFKVIEDKEDSKVLTVSATGEIEVPYLGRVFVAGKQIDSARKEIKALLEKDLYYQASVILAIDEAIRVPSALKLKQITVVGQVHNQGPQDLHPDEKYTLSRAILKSGGFASFANARKVVIIRKTADGKGEKITADVLAVLKDGEMDKDIELQPDDMVIVPEKLINF
jgi:polysaccharide biosynthesis/export protein